MRKSTDIQLSIQKPCSQNWEEMSVNEKGRFCDMCNKSVVDFTAYSDQQLADFFRRPKGNVCGRLRNDQLEKPLDLQYSQNRPFSQFLINAALAIGLANSVYAKEKEPRAPIVQTTLSDIKEEKNRNLIIDGDSTRYISGTIIDKKTKETLPGVTILIDGTTIATSTNMNGIFKMDVPDHLQNNTIKVLISSIGYETQTVDLFPEIIALNRIIELNIDPLPQLTGVVAGGISYRRPRFWYRMLGWIRTKSH